MHIPKSRQVDTVAIVNITQAAKLAGLSRSYFQKKYIKSGLISSSIGEDGHKKIDTSEILRVFGKLEDTPEHSDNTVLSDQQNTPENTPHIEQQIRMAELEVENRMLKERMDEMKEQYSTQLRLLEHMVENHKPWWKLWK